MEKQQTFVVIGLAGTRWSLWTDPDFLQPHWLNRRGLKDLELEATGLTPGCHVQVRYSFFLLPQVLVCIGVVSYGFVESQIGVTGQVGQVAAGPITGRQVMRGEDDDLWTVGGPSQLVLVGVGLGNGGRPTGYEINLGPLYFNGLV